MFRLCPRLGVLVNASPDAKKLRPEPDGVNPVPEILSEPGGNDPFLGVPCLLLGRLADHPTTAATAVAAAPEAVVLLPPKDERRGDSFTRLSQDARRALQIESSCVRASTERQSRNELLL